MIGNGPAVPIASRFVGFYPIALISTDASSSLAFTFTVHLMRSRLCGVADLDIPGP
jgi:hypothetical protein